MEGVNTLLTGPPLLKSPGFFSPLLLQLQSIKLSNLTMKRYLGLFFKVKIILYFPPLQPSSPPNPHPPHPHPVAFLSASSKECGGGFPDIFPVPSQTHMCSLPLVFRQGK